MEGNARTWFTPKQKAALWERWKSGQCVPDIARAPIDSEPQRGQDILIAGCGTGYHAFLNAQYSPDPRILAIDISRTSLAYARRKTWIYRPARIRIFVVLLHDSYRCGRRSQPSDSRGRSPEALCDSPYRPTGGNATRDLYAAPQASARPKLSGVALEQFHH